MNIQEIHSSSLAVSAFATVTVTIATDTTTYSSAIDRRGYSAIEFFVNSGVITDGAYTITLVECDTSGGTYTDVAAGNQLGASAAKDNGAIYYTSSIAFALTEDQTVKRIGYTGTKNFVKLKIVSTGTTTGGIFGGVVVKANAMSTPVTAA